MICLMFPLLPVAGYAVWRGYWELVFAQWAAAGQGAQNCLDVTKPNAMDHDT